jgi:predicted phosphoadenosine phosphosulfate sulfurtransferase
VRVWEGRCYCDGIPDEVPKKVALSNRAPSYKAIAMAILNNDHTLKSLGFSGRHSKYYDQLKAEEIRGRSKQLRLI